MKILLVLNQLGVGGVQRKAALLAVGLIERGHQVDVATFYGGGSFAEPIEQAGGHILALGESGHYGAHSLPIRIRLAAQRLWRLRTLVRSGRYDVVYGLGPTAGVYSSLASAIRGPKVAWGIELIPANGDELASYVSFVARRADLVIAVSNDVQDALLARGFPPVRTVVIENGVDMERFRIDPDARRTARAELGLDDEAVLVGTIGRISPVKRIETFLDVCSEMASQNNLVRFVIVGSGEPEYIGKLKQQATRLGIGHKLTWTGSRPDVEQFNNALDLYVSTSANEGLPLARIEAMACGTPCVVTDVADARATVGRFGAVVPIGDTAGIANAAVEALRNREAWPREAIRAWVIDRFSAARQVARTEAALLELVRNV